MKKLVNVLSAVSLPLELRANENPIGTATGFFLKRHGNEYLVTNWHVLSGRDPNTGQPRHSSGAIPDSFRIKLHLQDEVGSYIYGVKYDLLDIDGNPQWLQHRNGQEYDVACLMLRNRPENSTIYDAYVSHNPNMEVSVGDEVFILGFPRGMSHQRIFPIWKRGTVAAEPHIEREDKKPMLLVDSATREGMSGAPVYRYATGIVPMTDGSTAMYNGYCARFIGAYSGRYISEQENEIQIGRVWTEQAILEMINNPELGSFALKKQA